jgi:hypothetical protein
VIYFNNPARQLLLTAAGKGSHSVPLADAVSKAALPDIELSYPEWWRDWPREATATVSVGRCQLQRMKIREMGWQFIGK